MEVLVTKTLKACHAYDVKQLIMAGGVAANKGLRAALSQAVLEELPEVKLIVPPLRLCGDNAAMIGAAASIELAKGNYAGWNLNADPSLTLSE